MYNFKYKKNIRLMILNFRKDEYDLSLIILREYWSKFNNKIILGGSMLPSLADSVTSFEIWYTKDKEGHEFSVYAPDICCLII